MKAPPVLSGCSQVSSQKNTFLECRSGEFHFRTFVTMSFLFTSPRSSLSPGKIQSASPMTSRLFPEKQSHERTQRHCPPCLPSSTNPAESPYDPNHCYDWIFSSASNVHVATDRSIFKDYSSFKTYVLAVADCRQILVEGIGSVNLTIRCKKGGKRCHTITLENVLHIPNWMCNVFSDVYFEALRIDFEHSWGKDGVQFMTRREDNTLVPWGFTEEFCGLERLVLARIIRARSPMLEDPERTVFSINIHWPQGQRDQWRRFVKSRESSADARSVLLQKDGNVGNRNQSSPTKNA